MTAPPEPPAAPEPPVTPDGGQEPPPPPDEPDGASASREAATYRRRLRDVEGERDQLRERLEGVERAEVERIAGEHPYSMIKPSDLWLVGVSLDDMRGDDGRLDPRLVANRVREVVAERPTWARQRDMGLGARIDGSLAPVEPKPGLSALLGKGKR